MVNYNRFIISGAMPGAERWSCGFTLKGIRVAAPDFDYESYDDLKEWADNAYAAIDSWWTDSPVPLLRSMLSSGVTIDTVRTEYWEDGELAQAAEADNVFLAGNGTYTRPNQIALVVTTLTGRPGRSYKGRFYWPAVAGPALSATGRISGTDLVADSAADLMIIISEETPNGGLTHVVHSPTLDILTPVSAIRVGDVLDTQRRRRDAIAEAYHTRPLDE